MEKQSHVRGEVVAENTPQLPKRSSVESGLIVRFIRGITVEPCFLLFSISFGMERDGLTNLWVDKECANLYAKDICQELNSGKYPVEQDHVQKLVNKYKVTYSQWIENLPAIFIVLILGAWSDTKDRRLPVAIPFIGYVLKCVVLVINSYFWSWSSIYLLFASMPVGLAGGMNGLILACSSYLGAVSDVRSRTVRISVMGILLLGSMPLGKAITATLLKHYGYIGVFSVEGILLLCGFIYSLLRLEKHPRSPEGLLSNTKEISFCKMTSAVELGKTLLVPFKKREGGIRSQILGHMIIIATLLFDLGAINFYYLYTRKKFEWDFYTFTTWSEISTPVAGFGTVFVMPILSYRYKVEDSVLGLMGAFSYMFSNLIIATAPVGWVMYVAIASSMFSGMAFVASRGALSKLVPQDELGAIFSVVALGECIMPIINGPFYTLVYNATLEVFPGTIFAVTAGIFAAVACIYTWLLSRPDKPKFN